MGVTAIKLLENRTSYDLALVFNRESDQWFGAERDRPAKVDIWIPWCTKVDDFPKHHLWVFYEAADPGQRPIRSWTIWQAHRRDGDFVRCSDGRYWDHGHAIRGFAAVNGDRRLLVYDDYVELRPMRPHA